MQTITGAPVTYPFPIHQERKCNESAHLPVENLTCGKVLVTAVAHTTTHMHIGEVYRESLAYHLLKSETEFVPFLTTI